MKNLIEISKIVTKKKVRKIEIFDDHSLKHKNSKFNEFYEALQANKFKNDRDAASFLYGCSPTDDKYRQLKSRFRKRLLNTLFFLDVNLPSTSTYDRAYYSCNKDWTLVKILLSNDATHTAAALARQILTTALKYKFADVIVNCSRILRRYAATSGDDRAYEEYDEHIKHFENVLDAEIRSEELYQRVIMNYFKPPQKTEDLVTQIDEYCDALVGLSEVYDSPVVIYNMYLVWAYRYEMLKDFEAVVQVCQRAENYIQENPRYYQEEKLVTFQLKKMSAYLHMGNYKEGKIIAERGLQNFKRGSNNWFSFMEYYLLLALHTENYINALAIFNRAVDNTRFKRLDIVSREKWKIYEAYLHFIIESEGKTQPILQTQKRKSFRLNRLLEHQAIFPKDQRILTLHVLVAQILFQLETNNFSAATERIDKLKQFATRQLKRPEYHRPTQFVRLLQQLSKADFRRDNLSNTDKYLRRLREQPFFYRGLIYELEVIPYEKLWDYILTKLIS